ncbi:F-box/LRR-repeat protein At4g14096-like [Lotus japonicus]|uniref:F-box/LRR-repeat protein At4g14096-like n=1 Tax=Lotus japonicus TaxID=34305 RepID=UPI00258E58FE|nr:F-box/LRR-repeat protein At4g14096-like [Lotus japonicus]
MSNSTDEMLISPKAKRGRHNKSENEDRLSNLPDCILLHLLSFLKVKYAVQTCVLSTRWKDLWKRLHNLILLSSDFSSLRSFTKFMSRLLTLRDGSIALQNLDFEREGFVEPHLLKRIMKYAVSHNIQQLRLSVRCDIKHFPHCIISSKTLTSLKLAIHPKVKSPCYKKQTLFPKSLYNLPALTSLHLVNFAFWENHHGIAEPFSAFIKLNSLIIENCSLSEAHCTLSISSRTLCHLTVFNQYRLLHKTELSSPSLRTFAFEGTPYQKLTGSNLSSLEQVHINVANWSLEQEDREMLMWANYPQPPFILLSWLLKLPNIKLLTFSACTLQALFLFRYTLKLKAAILSDMSLELIENKTGTDFIWISKSRIGTRSRWNSKLSASKLYKG